jgi:hypothetical protein
MATSGRGTGMVGYNVQSAVDDKHHLIVAHEVTNVGHDRNALATMAEQARLATGTEDLNVVADRGYFATSVGSRSSPASKPASQPMCPSR